MGIRGLFTLIQGNVSVYETIDLISEAKSNNGIEILVDFHAFLRDLIEIISKKIVEDNDNKYLYYLTAEYDIFTESMYDFHKHLNDAGIKLVWIIDGPKGLDELASTQKMETWIKRDNEDIKSLENLQKSCEFKECPEKDHNLEFMFTFDVVIHGLKKAGAEIIQLLQGGSDEFIAYEFRKRKSYAVITNDTDFVIFPGLRILFPRLLRLKYENETLKLPFIDNENPGKIFMKPDSFKWPIVTHIDMLKLFKFTNPDHLIALSVIKGNDNTEEYARELQHNLGMTKFPGQTAHITRVASYVGNRKVDRSNIFQLPGMNQFLREYPQFPGTVAFCYDFYSLKTFEKNFKDSRILYDPTMDDGSLRGFFRKKLSKLEITKKSYSIHCGIFQDSILFEKRNSSCPLITQILSTIRSMVYPYVLDEDLDEVTEWQTRNSLKKITIPLKHALIKTNKINALPDAGTGAQQEDSAIYGCELFEEIWSHLEKESLKYFKSFGIEKGFICYLLRYFYKTTVGKNLRLSRDEFKAVFVTVFYQYGISKEINFKTKLTKTSFLGMRICPTEICLIICSWFTSMYFTGKYLCGGAFNLSNHFPSIDQMMSASVIIAFYELAMADKNQRIYHLDESIIESMGNLEKQILELYSAEYEAVTK